MTKQKEETADNCNHKDERGSYTYEKEDNRCNTDRGIMGSVAFICLKCNKDIKEEVQIAWENQSGQDI